MRSFVAKRAASSLPERRDRRDAAGGRRRRGIGCGSREAIVLAQRVLMNSAPFFVVFVSTATSCLGLLGVAWDFAFLVAVDAMRVADRPLGTGVTRHAMRQ